MSRFFAIVPWILCVVPSQAAPMVPESNSQTTDQAPAMEVVVPNVDSLPPSLPLPPVIREQPPSAAAPQSPPQLQPPPQPCPANLPPCPPACEATSKPSTTAPDKEKEPEKKTGWMNGVANGINYLYKSFYETLVGKDGWLTNLVYKTGDARPKKKQKSNGKGNGSTKACCIFYDSPPPVKDEEVEEDDGRPASIQVPPITCTWVRTHNQSTSSSVPGVPSAVTTTVPGTKTRSKSNQINFCCVGKRVINIKHFINTRIKSQFNCCAVAINTSAVEA